MCLINKFKSLSKDNQLNLKFGLAMNTGIVLGICLKQYTLLSFIIIWSTLLLVPYFTKKAAKVTFDTEHGFFNGEGKSLAKSYPTAFFGIFLGIMFIGAAFNMFCPRIATSLQIIIFSTILFSTITRYFIRKNCPIAILFDRHAWFGKVPGFEHKKSSILIDPVSHKRHTSSTSPRSWQTDPAYHHLGGNVFHR